MFLCSWAERGIFTGRARRPTLTSLLSKARFAAAEAFVREKGRALDAALLNGTASHALDYDDFSQPMGGHQSVPLVAPLLALAEERKHSQVAEFLRSKGA